MLNKCTFIGNLGADPEIRHTQNSQVTNFNIACTEKWKDQSGQMQERTEWVRLVLWGHLAELAGKYLTKGDRIYVEGRLQTSKWQDKNGGDRYTTEIVVQKMLFLSTKRSSGGSKQQYEPPPESYTGDDVPF